VRLAERMATGDQCDGLLIVHRHTAERLANIDRRGERVGIAVRAFRIHVDQTHLHRRERLFEITFAGVALVVEPRGFRTPINVFVGLPRVDAAAAESERPQSHRFECAVSRKDHEVGPRDLSAVPLLDRPQ